MRVFGYISVLLLLPLLLAFTSVDSPTQGTTASDTRQEIPDSLARTYRHTDAVRHLTIEGDTLAARNIWLDILSKDSTYSPALYNLSRTDNNRARGLEYARRAYLSDSTNKWYTEHFANSLVASHHYKEAIPIYRRLIRLDQRAIQAYHALAILYHGSGMPYSAISILDSAEIRLGYNSYLAGIKQNLLIDTRQYDKAIAEGRRITEEHPYDTDALTSLAIAYEASGKDSLARLSYEQAFRIDSNNLKTLNAIIDYYARASNTPRMLDYEERIFRDKRITIDEKLRRLEDYTSNISVYHNNFFRIGGIIMMLAVDYPDNRRVIDNYASHLIAAGEDAQALDYLRTHLDDDTATDTDYIAVLQLEQYLKRDDLANEDLERAKARFPQSSQLLIYSGFMAMERGDYNGAIELIKSALKEVEDDAKRSELWGYIGDIYHEAENDKASFKAYRKALDYNPDNILVLNNYAYFLSLLGKNLDEALDMATRATTLEKGNATYLDTLGWILHLVGRNDEAKVIIRQALSINKQEDADILAHYGDVLWALGEKFMAETYWQKAVDKGYDAEKMKKHIEQKRENKP